MFEPDYSEADEVDPTELDEISKKWKEDKERWDKIAQRHITDYTNNYDMDFA